MGIHNGSAPKRKTFYTEHFEKGLLLTYITHEPGGMIGGPATSITPVSTWPFGG